MAHVAVVGVGAIGGALAGLLETTGQHSITLCTRRPMESLLVRMPDGDVVVNAANALKPEDVGPVDWVIVTTKAYDAEGTSAWLRVLCAEGARVAVVQNGVEHRERFAEAVNPALIVPVIIDCPVERLPDGSVHQRGVAKMWAQAGADGNAFAELFAGSKAVVEITDDFLTAAWRKLCINAAGAVSALMLKPSGVLQDQGLAQVAWELVEECVAVGRAEGARLADGMADEVLGYYERGPKDSVNSMLADRMAGRQMEIEARNGVIVRRGEMHGIPTPYNRMTVALLKGFQGGGS